MSSTITTTKTENSHVKNKNKDLKEATSGRKNDNTIIENVKHLDNVCNFTRCKNKTNLIAIDCKFCKGRFCTTHGLQEVHGCGEAVKRDERRNYLHPDPKLSHEKHDKVQTKFNMKMKQLQQERKSKQGFQQKGTKNNNK